MAENNQQHRPPSACLFHSYFSWCMRRKILLFFGMARSRVPHAPPRHMTRSNPNQTEHLHQIAESATYFRTYFRRRCQRKTRTSYNHHWPQTYTNQYVQHTYVVSLRSCERHHLKFFLSQIENEKDETSNYHTIFKFIKMVSINWNWTPYAHLELGKINTSCWSIISQRCVGNVS